MTGRRTVPPVSTINLKTGPGASAANHPYPQRSPVLGLVFGGVQVLVTTSAGDRVTVDDLEFARCLAREAASFARSVERMFHGLPNGEGVAVR
ncbi:hypothetical protein [Microbispora hainanensis]|uniref:Uncharacterized protein n=1 Tax=Microbispora hainanensis TaxID=568844 RepID=A0A544XY32_9ACTN|nr:hypothetical protein [Microbispora hainanensis]TQS09397.1 hypothetical protein FLX08_38550 [Microbispora hainanensis]